jgi:hypothetical protein
MLDDGPKPTLDYRSHIARVDGERSFAPLLLTWSGPASFVIFYLVGLALAAGDVSRILLGVYLLLCAVAPAFGLAAGVFGLRSRSRGLVGIGLGVALNAALIGIQVVIVALIFLQRGP